MARARKHVNTFRDCLETISTLTRDNFCFFCSFIKQALDAVSKESSRRETNNAMKKLVMKEESEKGRLLTTCMSDIDYLQRRTEGLAHLFYLRAVCAEGKNVTCLPHYFFRITWWTWRLFPFSDDTERHRIDFSFCLMGLSRYALYTCAHTLFLLSSFLQF